MKCLLFVMILLPCLFMGCVTDSKDDPVIVEFILDNDLLWNIGHDYQVGGKDKNGKDFKGEEHYVRYLAVILSKTEIKKNSSLKLYKNGNEIWDSGKISKSTRFTYHDSPVSGGDTVDRENI